jgi:hypothetical protein
MISLNPNKISLVVTFLSKKGGLMLIPALLATALTACPQAPVQEQQINARALTTPKDTMLHGIIAGTSFQSNQGFTLQNGSSIHANTGLSLNSRNIVLNGGQVSSTSAASCSDNSGQGFCLDGKPKFVNPIVNVPKPDVTALKAKYTAVPVVTIQGNLNLNSSSDISSRFDNKIVLVKGNVNLNAIATIKNAVLMVEQDFKSNKGITLENSRIITKSAGLNQTTILNNSRIITDEDLSFNGKLESTGLSSVVSSKNLTTNQGVTSSSGELAVIANMNITINQSSSGKIALWAGGNITLNQSSSLEGSVVAGGKVTLNQGVILIKVLQHVNGDVLGGGQLPFGTREEVVMRAGETWTTSFGVTVTMGNVLSKPEARVFVEIVDSLKLGKPLPAGYELASALYRIGAIGGISTKGLDLIKVSLPLQNPNPNRNLAFFWLIPEYFLGGFTDELYWDTSSSLDPQNETKITSQTSVLLEQGFQIAIGKPPVTSQVFQGTKSSTITTQSEGFSVACQPKPLLAPTTCKESEFPRVLEAFRTEFQNIERIMDASISTAKTAYFVGSTKDSCRRDATAYLNSRENEIRLCVKDDGDNRYLNLANGDLISPSIQNTLRHELFHGFQYTFLSYVDLAARYQQWQWILEGTADAAVSSDETTMRVKTTPPIRLNRRVTEHLLSNDSLYETQDFWVYAGLKKNFGLRDYKALFQTKLLDPMNDLNNFFIAKGFADNGMVGMQAAYWLWAKNQGYEHSIDLRAADANKKCKPDSSTLFSDYRNHKITHPLDETKVILNSSEFNDTAILQTSPLPHIAPLETRAVRVQFSNNLDLSKPENQKLLLFKVTKPDGSSVDSSKIKYKFYVNPAPDPSNCGLPENQEARYRIGKLTSSSPNPEVVVLISNVNIAAANTTKRTNLEEIRVSVQRIEPLLKAVPTGLTLNGTVISTLTQSIALSNDGDVLSDMEYRSYPISTGAVIVTTPGVFPDPPIPDDRFANPSSTVASGVLRKPDPDILESTVNLQSVSVTYECKAKAEFSSGFAVAYKTQRLLPIGVPEILVVNVPISVNCKDPSTLELLSQPVKEVIEGYTEGGTFIYEPRFVTTVVKNKSSQVLNYKATSLQPFNKVLKESREAPASSRDFVDLLLECPNGAGTYTGRTELISTDIAPITYAVVPVDLECLEKPKPTLTPAEASRPAVGLTYGDPHIMSFDEMHYEGQKAGEFVLAKSLLADGFELQARFEDVIDSQVWSATTAIALRIDGYRIGVYLNNGNLRFRVNGTEIFLQNGNYNVSNDITISRFGRFTISSKSGYGIRFGSSGISIDTEVLIPPRTRGQVRGLLGDADGNPLDDFMLRNGTQARSPIDIDGLMGFLESWRINSGESLFDYEAGESNLGFTDLSFPINKSYFSMYGITALPPEQRVTAEDICRDAKIFTPAIFRNCVFDVGLTQDEIWARVAERIDPANLFVAIIPNQLKILPSSSVNLQAFATHQKSVAELIWTTTAGTILSLPDGVMQYIAPELLGTYQIRASLRDNPAIFDEIEVIVSQGQPLAIDWSSSAGIVVATDLRTLLFNPLLNNMQALSNGFNEVAAITRDGTKWIVNSGFTTQIQNTQGSICEFQFALNPENLFFSPNEQFIISSRSDTGIAVWSVSTCNLVWQKTSNPQSVDVGDNKLVYLESDSVIVLNLETGEEIWRFSPYAYGFVSVAINPFGSQIAVLRPGLGLFLYDIASQSFVSQLNLGDYSTQVRYSPDGSKAFLFDTYQTIICETSNWQVLTSINHVFATDIAWSPSSSAVAILQSSSIRTYDANFGTQLQVLGF